MEVDHPVAELAEKKKIILEHEKKLANAVSAAVIQKPVLSIWLILIPIFFVYYFYRLKTYAGGREDFAKNFLVTRERALDAAYEALENDRKPDVRSVVAMTSAPQDTHADYGKWVKVLVEHYHELLQANGTTYEGLVRVVYKNRTNYLLFLNQLKIAENRFDEALKPHLRESIEGLDGITRLMEQSTETFRREHVKQAFP